MDDFTEAHLNRLDSMVNPSSGDTTIEGWITSKTFIKGEPFSFVDHEYQQFILSLKAQVMYIQKSSQIGISELQVRWVLAFLALHRGVNSIYCLPSAKFSEKFSQTRVTPVIQGSPFLTASLHADLDSAAVKRFMNDSMIFFQGASKASQAISVPCDLLVADELNFMLDPSIVTAFASRLTHSSHALERYFSTPTFANHGVSQGVSKAKRYHELQKCRRCGHWFQPDYFKDVKLPGFNAGGGKERSLHEITFLTKEILDKFEIDTAYLACPKCQRPVDQSIANREFVAENPDSTAESVGVLLTPFCCPRHMPPSKMIRTSVKYRSRADFYNNCLGLPYDDESSGLTREELLELFVPDISYPDHPPFQISGTDMGGTCFNFTAFPSPNGHLRIMTAELIPLHLMRTRFPQSLAENLVLSSVMDAMPYTDLVSGLQGSVPTLWAAIKTDSKATTEMFSIREQEDDESKATYGLRQVNFRRNLLYDFLVAMIRAKQISFHPSPSMMRMQETIISHLTDMKRLEITNKYGEPEYNWVKSADGADHAFHALSFLILANAIKGLAGGMPAMPFLVQKVRIKQSP